MLYDIRFEGGLVMKRVHEKFVRPVARVPAPYDVGTPVEVMETVRKARVNRAARKTMDCIKSFQSQVDAQARSNRVKKLRWTSTSEEVHSGKNQPEAITGIGTASEIASRAAARHERVLADMKKERLAQKKKLEDMQAGPGKQLTVHNRPKWTIGLGHVKGDREQIHEHNRVRREAKNYGTAAQLKSSIEAQLLTVSRRILDEFRDLIQCEKASIMFHNPWESKLSLFLDDGSIIEFSSKRGIAGEVVRTGVAINVADAYTLPFFNRAVDRQTGYRTKSVLCQPIYSVKSKSIVAVIQMLNKIGSDGIFTEGDAKSVESCSTRISRSLEDALEALVSAQAGLARSRRQAKYGDKPYD